MAETFTWCPLLGAERTRTPRLFETRYGDGYSHRTTTGINILQDAWSVSFVGDETMLTAIDAFLSSNGVPGFWFHALPSDPLILVVCDEWRLGWTDRSGTLALGSLSAVFRRNYNIQPGGPQP